MFEQFVVGIATLLMGFFPATLFAPVATVEQPLRFIRPEPVPQIDARATILFGGDMMFDRFIRIKTEKMGDDFALACLDDILWSSDIVVANIEGPITEYPSMSVGSEIGSPENFTFTFPPSTAPLLARHNIHAVNLGNNHIRNFGEEGVRQTLQFLADAGVGYFGTPPENAALYRLVSDVPVAFVSYNEFGGSSDTTLRQIATARGEGFLPIVYTHWGDEYATTSAPRQQRQARAFVDAGAEIVIGSHPHVIQEHEIYGGRYIYYSLGNLVFDQYWNEDVRTGLLLRVELSQRGVEDIEEIRVTLMLDGRVCPSSEPRSGRINAVS